MSKEPTPESQPQQKGLATLADVSFRHYATQRVVPVLYVLVLLLAVLEAIVLLATAVASLAGAFNALGVLVGLLWLAATVLVPAITVVMSRVVLEFFIVQFRILDAVTHPGS